MKIKFYTLGCKVNQYESQALQEQLKMHGFMPTRGIADIYIINSCSITAKADSDSRRLILKARKENPLAKIAVCGCWVNLNRKDIEKFNVDYIVSQNEKFNLANIINDSLPKQKNIWSLNISNFFNQRAFVKIQDGCNNFCSFCKVPHLRGPSVSRDKKEIIDEIKRLGDNHKEIVLCGVNLGAYGKDFKHKVSLADLLNEILEIKSLGRLRLSSIEPRSVDSGIIELFHHPKMCPHIHLPFQSGDNAILRKMNKEESVQRYEAIISKLRDINQGFAISCDIIVGFPGEDDTQFNNTLNFIKKIIPMRTHIFTFSPRENTIFSKQQINHVVAKQRYRTMKSITNLFALEYKRNFLGKLLYAIAEERLPGYTCGYTQNYIKVKIKGRVELGTIVPVILKKIENDTVLAFPEKKPCV